MSITSIHIFFSRRVESWSLEAFHEFAQIALPALKLGEINDKFFNELEQIQKNGNPEQKDRAIMLLTKSCRRVCFKMLVVKNQFFLLYLPLTWTQKACLAIKRKYRSTPQYHPSNNPTAFCLAPPAPLNPIFRLASPALFRGWWGDVHTTLAQGRFRGRPKQAKLVEDPNGCLVEYLAVESNPCLIA